VHGCKGERQHLPTSSCLTTPLFNRHGCRSTAGYRGRRALFQEGQAIFFWGAQAVGQNGLWCGEGCSPAAVIGAVHTATATTRNKTEQRYEHTPHHPPNGQITLQVGVIHHWVTFGGVCGSKLNHNMPGFRFFVTLAAGHAPPHTVNLTPTTKPPAALLLASPCSPMEWVCEILSAWIWVIEQNVNRPQHDSTLSKTDS
jgi:hypothetical protein